MLIHHIRNATMLLELGEHVILIDPMFADAGTMPGFKVFGEGKRANPTVALPTGARDAFERATAMLVTHEHPDHLDTEALTWASARGLRVGASGVDAPNLRDKGLKVEIVQEDFLGIPCEVVPAAHGRGLLGFLMGPVSGFYLAHPQEPSVYLTGDSVLTGTIRAAIERLEPDVIIAPAGAATFGIGPSVIFDADELEELARLAPGDLVFNHLEALDHCPTTRAGLRTHLARVGLGERVHIPNDGDVLTFERAADASGPARLRCSPPRGPGLQKWFTAKFMTGT